MYGNTVLKVGNVVATTARNEHGAYGFERFNEDIIDICR